MRNRIAWFVALVLGVSGAFAASSAEESEAGYGHWYRQIRLDTWAWAGADSERIRETLARIEAADVDGGMPDVGPGGSDAHWIREFVRTGEAARAEAANLKGQARADRLVEASMYFMIASFPHFREPDAMAALARAYEAYEQAGKLFEPPTEVWRIKLADRDETVTAYAHLPPHEGPWPVVLKTGGMDVLRIEFHPLRDALLSRGVALVLFDMPGTGNTQTLDAASARNHFAVLDRVLDDPRFDDERVALWSESLAGNPLVETTVRRAADVAAAVNDCGILHGLFATEGSTAPAETMQYHAYADRFRVDPHNLAALRTATRPVALGNKDLLGRVAIIDVPMLSVTTLEDPLVSLDETLAALKLSTRGELRLTGRFGHCAPRSTSMPAVVNWLEYQLLGGE
ncbi:MAG: alpha/beta hydrolase [Pseudomonadales bacterium]